LAILAGYGIGSDHAIWSDWSYAYATDLNDQRLEAEQVGSQLGYTGKRIRKLAAKPVQTIFWLLVTRCLKIKSAKLRGFRLENSW